MSEGIRGLEVPAVKRWLAANVDSADGELSFELVTAGGSNLTYRVENSDGQKWALRRPPERARIATANAACDAKIEEESARRAKEEQRFAVDTEIADAEKELSLKNAAIKEEVDVAHAQATKAGEMEFKVQK